MTEVVRRGANRASANARTRRAAQRTPLPPKGATSGVTKEASAQVARAVAGVLRFDVPGAEHAEITAPSGDTRAKRFEALAKAHGWDVRLRVTGPREEIEAKRGEESLLIEWVDGKYAPWASYVFDGAKRRVQNAKAGERLIQRSPQEAANAERHAKGSRMAREATKPATAGKTLDLASMSDADLLAAFNKGARVAWVNSISQEVEEARSFPNATSTHVSSGTAGRRIVTFPTYAGRVKLPSGEYRVMPGQIRSVAVESIISLR